MSELLVVIEAGATQLLQVAEQGPPGPPGPAGAPGGALLTLTAGAALSGHTAVAYTTAGTLEPASCDDALQLLRLVGITTGAALQGAPATVQRQDVLDHAGWTWVPGLPVFLGLAGALVQAVPAAAIFSQVIGVALTPTRVALGIQPPVVLA